MVFKNLCDFVLRTKVASELEGFKGNGMLPGEGMSITLITVVYKELLIVFHFFFAFSSDCYMLLINSENILVYVLT